MIEPTNTDELTVHFAKVIGRFTDWQIEQLSPTHSGVLLNRQSEDRFLATFEYESGDFERHGHDASRCDLIICWRHTLTGHSPHIWEIGRRGWRPDDPYRLPGEAEEPSIVKARRVRREKCEQRRQRDIEAVDLIMQKVDDRAHELSVRDVAKMIRRSVSYTHGLMRELGLL